MGTRKAKISPLKKTYKADKGLSTIQSSLSANGYAFWPGTRRYTTPFAERNGEYRTGLDPNALYIQHMRNEDEKQAEIEYVKSEAERIAKMTNGLNLSPNADYYVNMFNHRDDDRRPYANRVGLTDESIEFDLDVPFDDLDNGVYGAITYAWMRVHPDIAPSQKAFDENHNTFRCPDVRSRKYFVDDEIYQAEEDYKYNILFAQAMSKWAEMSPERQMKVAVLLGLGVDNFSKPSQIFNEGLKYIQNTKGLRKDTNVKEFLKIASYDEQYMDVAYTVEEALRTAVYFTKDGKIWNGKVDMGKTPQDVIAKLNTPEYQQDYILLKEKIQEKKSILLS